MGIPVIVYGKSGSGKSRSLKNFADDEILYVNVERKMLPFKGKFKYTLPTEDTNLIKEQLQKMPCKVAVIDDSTYIMVNQFMRRHRAKQGSSSFDLYNDIADYIWTLFETAKALPDDVIVYIIMHEETNDYGQTKIRTIGKLLDDKVQPEGICTICLRCVVDNKEHVFLTQSDGSDISKSPEGMFESEKIPNDLKAVDTAIRNYYGIETKEKENGNT